jgi:hypothetical protein
VPTSATSSWRIAEVSPSATPRSGSSLISSPHLVSKDAKGTAAPSPSPTRRLDG